jgi:hypothetical protein
MSARSKKQKKTYRLRIIFDGVIAIGPPHPKSGDEQGPLFGVMAHSSRRETGRSKKNPGGPRTFIPMHVPTLFTRMAPYGKDARKPDEIYHPPLLPAALHMWHPIRERMSFVFDDDDKPGKLTYQRESPAPVSDAKPKAKKALALDVPFDLNINDITSRDLGGELKLRRIQDVPDAREIWPDRCRLLPGLLDPKPNALAAAQIFVPRGHVCGGGVGPKGNGLDVVFQPLKPKSRKKKKNIVPCVVVIVEAEIVEIQMKSLDTGEKLDPLRFRLTKDEDIWISNGDPSDVAINVKRQALPVNEEERAAVSEKFFALEAVKNLKEDAVKREVANFVFHTDNFTFGPEQLQRADSNRIGDFDIDFELFYTLMDGEDDGDDVPLPRRADLQPFDTGNCYCKLVCRPEHYL